MKFLTALALAATIFVSGCSTMDPNAGSGEKTGEVGGAIVGGILGAVLGDMADCHGCAAIGAALGAGVLSQVGRNIGATMDREDRQRLNAAINNSRTGQTVAWQNPDTQMAYTVTPTKTYQSGGRACREVTIGSAKVGGKTKDVYTTACYDGAGGWEVQPK